MASDTVSQQHLSQAASHRAILVIVLVYALFASGWIILSDQWVEMIFSNSKQIIFASTFKGCAFVVVTSLLLYGLMQRKLGGYTKPNTPTKQSLRLDWPSLLLMAVVTLFTGIGTALHFHHHKEADLARLQETANLKARQISDWLKERQNDAEFIQTSDFLTGAYLDWQKATSPASIRHLQTHLELLRKKQGLTAVTLVDPTGKQLSSVTNSPQISLTDGKAIALPPTDGPIRRTDPYRDASGAVFLDYVVPLVALPSPAPTVILHINLTAGLTPVLQASPTAASPEPLLFRHINQQVSLLGKLSTDESAQQQTAVNLLNSKHFLETPVEFADGHGAAVIAVTCAIANTDWLLATKTDSSQFHAGALKDALWFGFVGLLMLLVAGAGFHLLGQYRQLTQAQMTLQAQTEELQARKVLAAIANSSNDAIFAQDLEGHYILCNLAASHFVGKPVEAVLGCTDQDLFPSEQAQMLIDTRCQIILENSTHSQEEAISTTKGERVFLSTKGPLSDEQGKVIGIFGICRDITEHKQAEAELKLWAQSFESANFGLVVVDAKTNKFLAVNPAFASERGYNREELVGQPITVLYPEELVAELKVKLQAVDANSHGVFESVHVRKDGSRFPVMLDITSIKSANGETVTRIAYALNLTEKKQAEAQLMVSEERLKLAIEATSDGIWDWNISDDSAYLTPRYYEMIGVLPSEAPADFNFFKNSIHPDDFPSVLAEMDTHFRGKTQSSEIEYRVTLPSGSIKWILGRGKVVERNPDGTAIRMAGTITDISQRKAAEESLRRKTEELSQRNDELERFNRLMIGRELDIIALKQQVNDLSRQLDQPPPYPLVFLNADS